eukprot:g3374.t1
MLFQLRKIVALSILTTTTVFAQSDDVSSDLLRGLDRNASSTSSKRANQDLNLMSVNNKDELRRAICMTSGVDSKLIIARMDVLKEAKGDIDCGGWKQLLRYREDKSDPGHVLVNVDAPTKGRLDCDGKADVGLSYIGLNCLLSRYEATDHNNPSD